MKSGVESPQTFEQAHASFAVSGSSVAAVISPAAPTAATVVCLPDVRECDGLSAAIGWIAAGRNQTACASRSTTPAHALIVTRLCSQRSGRLIVAGTTANSSQRC